MNYMIVFLIICICLGLWAPPKKKLAGVVLALAAALVVFFLLSPHRM